MPGPTDQLDKLRAAATLQLSNANTAEAIEAGGRILAQVIEIEKLAADAERARAERQKLESDMSSLTQRTSSEERRHLASLLAPLFTTVVLAGTLTLQTYQAITTEHDKQIEQQRQRESAEDIRWADTLKSLSGEIKGISPGSLSLITFFASPRYNNLARQTTMTVLLQTSDLAQFKQLFTAAFGIPIWTTLNDVLDFSRQMGAKNAELVGRVFKERADNVPVNADDQLKSDFFTTAQVSFAHR
jgi:hypothetical protein